MNTIVVNVPAAVMVQLKGQAIPLELDLANKPPDWWGWAASFAARQSSGDADAGKNGTPEGYAAILAKFDKIAAGEVPAGGGGGGARLSYAEKATRAILEGVFRDSGMKAAVAKKAATSNSAWEDVALLVLASENVEDPDDADIAEKVAEIQALLADDIAAKAAALEKADKKPSGLSKLGLGKK